MPKVLGHRTVVWVTELGSNRVFEVRTAEGFAAEYGADPKALVASNLKDGRPLADTLGIGIGYEAALEIQKRKGLQVSFGEVVEIEGRKYEVRHRSGGYEWDEVELVQLKATGG
ncbi:hypothetical protein ACVI1J_005151 [Bradyrhizobium diazoefficiens]